MNLYLLKQDINNTYDSYDSCIVVAPNKSIALTIHPEMTFETRQYKKYKDLDFNEFKNRIWQLENRFSFGKLGDSWVKFNSISNIKITYIGKASMKYKEPQCILASYNAG